MFVALLDQVAREIYAYSPAGCEVGRFKAQSAVLSFCRKTDYMNSCRDLVKWKPPDYIPLSVHDNGMTVTLHKR